MRAVVHIAGRPDPDEKQRCVVCRHELRRIDGFGKYFEMGRDVHELQSGGKSLGHSSGEGPADAVSVRCTAL